MKNRKQNTGIGNWHIDKAYKSKGSILKTLSDGQWHRNMELKEKTKLSSRTLAKHLNHMTNIQIIERKADIESGKYPVPVLYKTTPKVTAYINASIIREEIVNELEPALNETKDPLVLLDAIHAYSLLNFVELLKFIQQNKSVTDKTINFLAECFLWANYKQFTYKLIQASRKIINDFNITQLMRNQPKRQTKGYEHVLKIYEKREQKNAVPSKNATHNKPVLLRRRTAKKL